MFLQKRTRALVLALLTLTLTGPADAQTIPRDELLFLTSEWKGERFPDGRPRVSDDLIRRAARIGIEEAWTVLQNEGYRNQFEGNWKQVDDAIPVTGRAVTAAFLPSRPDVERQVKARGAAQGRTGDTNAWPIADLQRGDVLVVDGFGKIKDGTIIGDNLGNAIFTHTGTGVVIDGAVRDLGGLRAIKGFNALVRDFHPSFLMDMTLMGHNTPIRIGGAVVLPGDLVISEKTGVLFIPAHLAEKVVETAEFIGLKDRFGQESLKSGRFGPGDIDAQWSEPVRQAFMAWLDGQPERGTLTRAKLNGLLQKRTW
ncbi:regulator of RNase E activity RraA [Methylobacterium sp. PvP062]|uniref:Putative 4-hydroxy-4-methyl-2-oxoglutarate aldolase n=1 Tax=Methylobacterium radiotolerans TaxID=31998 RepID=A0ABV2NUF6_9HYPH|nr:MULTISPECIES: hypothetical protein [unclassified Methylobacterium]MBP2498309.1 regulator of RNase E activity RraA [Methylobacterium sp. PvP105]MBP2505693.1 regulator of RNase E activity RraA [Methylobacterium sp. PvP109]